MQTLAITYHRPHPLNHQPSGLEGCGLWINRRNAFGDLIGIQKSVYTKFLREEYLGCSGLTRTVGAP